DKCDSEKTGKELSLGNLYCHITSPKTPVCCESKNKDGTKSRLYSCYEPCNDPDGCFCPDHCKDKEGKHFKEVNPGQNCQGGYGLENPCSGPTRQTRDFQCPQGCYWFNDFDCGPDKNIGNVLWDYVLRNAVGEWYQKQWVEKMRLYGAYLNPDQWAKSVCNPRSENYKTMDGSVANAVYHNQRPAGWIAANRQPHGANHSLYTISYFITGLPQERKLTISLYDEKTNKYHQYYKKPINVSIGETKSDTIAFVNKTVYTAACLILDQEICLGEGVTKTCYQKICRDIIELKES
ncbi:MAG: hypothetical protein QW594_04275, partial [Candidatus Woesearchaeota archaeon]